MPRCDWCDHEHDAKWLYRLDKHPDRPLVCIDERACIRRELALMERRRIATAEERLGLVGAR